MDEEDIFKELFLKVDINYPIDDLDETVLKKIKKRNIYKKKRSRYALIGKIGMGSFVILCFLFAITSSNIKIQNFDMDIYIMLGIPFILLLMLIQLEVLFDTNINKQVSL